MQSDRGRIGEKNNRVGMLVFLAWLVYTSSYLGKVNYSANITQIVEFYGVTKAQAGTAPTFFFFAYGIGQVFNGVFCKKYNVKYVVFFSLIVSAFINLWVAVGTNFFVIKWLWMINGFVLSILWPTLVRLISETLPQKHLGRSSVIMGTTTATGTLVIYGLSAVYAAMHHFKFAFYTAGIVVFVVAVIWFMFYDKSVASSKEEREREICEGVSDGKVQKNSFQSAGPIQNFMLTTCVLCFCAVGVNLMKDGLTTWVPSILKETFGVTDSLSILLTLFLPMIAMFGNLCALNVHKKIPNYIHHCMVVFAVIALFIGLIIQSIHFAWVLPMLAGLIIANFLASSLNSLITNLYPLFMRVQGNSGMIAGVLNGFAYVGSTISAYGLGVVADRFGWLSVFYVLLGFCFVAFAVWGAYTLFMLFEKKKERG